MRRFLVLLVLGSFGLSACEITTEDALIAATVIGLAAAASSEGYDTGYYSSYYGGYGYPSFRSVPGRNVRYCASRGNARPRLVYGTLRSGGSLSRVYGRNRYRGDFNYLSIPTNSGTALLAIPAYATFATGPVYARDQAGVPWRLTLGNGYSCTFY